MKLSDLAKLLKYADLVDQLLLHVRAAEKLKRGEQFEIPPVRAKIGKGYYELGEHYLRRLE